ncbi:putative phosphoesterase [Pseudomonas phage vB_PsyM_KIL2]|uniref:Putative phosphoesterase n=1 Tax=Pseudomonas phage vB_PsyM_KIL2 TaxID=1777066 RepID=A0A142IDX4_9CAUD|nr:putative phosphoesterase [Pseudomonas phage vB_PsyM_KIL2]
MSNIWFTSDLHFGHKNVIECCNRPWTCEEQDAEIVRRWNSRVGLFDEVYHLGR